MAEETIAGWVDAGDEYEVTADGIRIGLVWQTGDGEWVAQSHPLEIVTGFPSRQAAAAALASGEV